MKHNKLHKMDQFSLPAHSAGNEEWNGSTKLPCNRDSSDSGIDKLSTCSRSSEEDVICTDDETQLVPCNAAIKQPKTLSQFWIILGVIATHPVVSICLISITVMASVTFGVIAIFVVEPKPYFDQSLDAFQIPYHESTLNSELFQRALVDNTEPESLHGRFERDVSLPSRKRSITKFDNLSPSKSVFSKSWDHLFGNQKSPPLKKSNRHVTKSFLSRRKRSSSSHFRNRNSYWKLEMVYVAKPEGANIFTSDRLKVIHDVEMQVMSYSGFSNFCARMTSNLDDQFLDVVNFCTPPNSLMTYFFPSFSGSKVFYNGMGSELADINGTLDKAMSQETFYWYVDPDMDTTLRRSRFIRSEFWFGKPIGENPDIVLSSDGEFQLYKDFLWSLKKDVLEDSSTENVDVLYGGNELFDQEVAFTIHHDLMLAIPTLVAIATLLFVLTSFSVWLTLCGIVSILSSFAWAYFSYHVLCGREALGLLNLVSAFVVIGIGVDDVFVFINTFRQAAHMEDLKLRMAHTIRAAGIATFFTSATTAGAFGANMASQIPAVYEFGLFMTFIISYCWLLVMLIMPAALTLWYKYLHCEQIIFKKIKSQSKSYDVSSSTSGSVESSNSSLDVLKEPGKDASSPGMMTGFSPPSWNGPLTDHDIPLLDLEVEPAHRGFSELMDDPELTLTLQYSSSGRELNGSRRETHETASLTKILGLFLKKFIGGPVVRGRWFILVGYGVLLVVTGYLVAQIDPASHPPAFFERDTNIQKLLDLAYNFSAQDISCKYCSGFHEPPDRIVPTRAVTKAPRPVPQPKPQPHTTPYPQPQPQPVSTRPVSKADRATTIRPQVTRPSCGSTTCPHHGICKDTPTGVYCSCDLKCDNIQDPVCDNFGVTHDNRCEFRRHECVSKSTLRIVHTGKCIDHNPWIRSTDAPSNKVTPRKSEPTKDPGPAHYNPCEMDSCPPPAEKPILRNTATVSVVFGLHHLVVQDDTHRHVMSQKKETIIYNKDFNVWRTETQRALCKMCHHLASRTDLVKPGGAECVPRELHNLLEPLAAQVPECRNLPVPNYISQRQSRSKFRVVNDTEVLWFSMAFESNIYEGQSSFEAFHKYLAWNQVIEDMLNNLTAEERIGLETAFQTSDYWKQVFMEIISVTSAIYGLALSLVVCIVSVVLFTGHIGIVMIALSTIFGILLMVVAMFYLLGWQMGAVEAVSLSILVGSSVDYCIHLIEGYLMADDLAPPDLKNSQRRRWKTKQAVSTIGVSIFSSALTTIIAAVPLCFTTIQMFSKFGKIVAINTSVAIIYTLTVCAAFLSTVAPSSYRWSFKWLVVSILIVGAAFGAVLGGLYIAHGAGITIPGPSGGSLF